MMNRHSLALVSALLSLSVFAASTPGVDFTRPTQRTFNPALHGAGYAPTIDSRASYVADPDIKALNLYESRTHDWFVSDRNQRVMDVDNVFPLLHLDPSNTANYVFAQTDDEIRMTRSSAAGAQRVCYRLGRATDGTGMNVYNAIPTNYAAYAEACAGIVRHYTRKWANGMTNVVDRWEIWDSPDTTASWYREGLTAEQLRDEFATFFATVLKRLRDEFGDTITIGGPGLATDDRAWFGSILDACAERGVRPDFVSWRTMTSDVSEIASKATEIRQALDGLGYSDVGLVLDAWRYMPGDGEGITWNVSRESFGNSQYNISSEYNVHGIASAVFVVRTLCALQEMPFERAYYYGSVNRRGLWCYSFGGLTKNWYALKLFGSLVGKTDALVETTSSPDMTVFGALSADRRRGYLVVTDNRADATDDLRVTATGLDGAQVVSAVVLDRSNNLSETTATIGDAAVTLARRASGPSAFLVEVAFADDNGRTISCGKAKKGAVPLTFGPGSVPLMLVAAYGTADGGYKLSNWDAVKPVAVIPAETTSYSYPLPDGWGDTVTCLGFFFARVDEVPFQALDKIVADKPGMGRAKPQWLAPGTDVSSSTKISLTLRLSDLTKQTRLFSATGGDATPYQRAQMYINGSGYPAIFCVTSASTDTKKETGHYKAITTTEVTSSSQTTWTLDLKNRTATYAVGSASGTTIKDCLTVAENPSGPLMLFATTSDTHPGVLGDIYLARIWENDELIRDLRPAMGYTNATDCVPGMYDAAQCRFYPSAGTNAFTAGNVTTLPPSWLENVLSVSRSATVVPPSVATNAMTNASWGYEVRGLGDDADEVALVFTNVTETMSWTVPAYTESISYLAVGGGGGGGGYIGGGGGAGRMIESENVAVSAGSTVVLTVGAGGKGSAAQVTDPDATGKPSTLTVGALSVIAAGGGYGGYGDSVKRTSVAGIAGGAGGSGGGAGGVGSSTNSDGSQAQAGGAAEGTSGWGFAGGAIAAGKLSYCGAGGGGAGAAGHDATAMSAPGGIGGAGRTSAITGASLYYAAGGSGGSGTGAPVPGQSLGGGGAGGYGTDKSDGTFAFLGGNGQDGRGSGGGGGGSGAGQSTMKGGNGGAGVVIIRYREVPAPGTMLWLR